ncbi:MAG: Ku protein [Myxococcota bacterium]
MPARATSSGTISFGLVSIPVKVYPATRSKTIRFNWLHGKDRSRVKQQYVSANTGEKVERDELVKGYEYARDQYVVMTEEEFKAIESKSDRTIEIEEFVPIENVDPIHFDKANLLGPDKGGAKAYRLLNEAMTLMGKVAVGRFSTRGRQQLVLLRPFQRGLVLHGLFYADEVRSFDDIEFGDEVDLRKAEVDLATQLIEQLSTQKFEPGKFEDEYRQAVLAAVEQKVAGEEVVAVSRSEPQDQIIDLVAALKKTLAEKQQGAPAATGARKPAKAKGKSKKKAPAKRKAASR